MPTDQRAEARETWDVPRTLYTVVTLSAATISGVLTFFGLMEIHGEPDPIMRATFLVMVCVYVIAVTVFWSLLWTLVSRLHSLAPLRIAAVIGLTSCVMVLIWHLSTWFNNVTLNGPSAVEASIQRNSRDLQLFLQQHSDARMAQVQTIRDALDALQAEGRHLAEQELERDPWLPIERRKGTLYVNLFQMAQTIESGVLTLDERIHSMSELGIGDRLNTLAELVSPNQSARETRDAGQSLLDQSARHERIFVRTVREAFDRIYGGDVGAVLIGNSFPTELRHAVISDPIEEIILGVEKRQVHGDRLLAAAQRQFRRRVSVLRQVQADGALSIKALRSEYDGALLATTDQLRQSRSIGSLVDVAYLDFIADEVARRTESIGQLPYGSGDLSSRREILLSYLRRVREAALSFKVDLETGSDEPLDLRVMVERFSLKTTDEMIWDPRLRSLPMIAFAVFLDFAMLPILLARGLLRPTDTH